ncbi:MAG: sulfatase-like hydrolase/transferase [Prosthecobacter sp.]|nr:sulfatase-like hydrolase/transferase [Prosthecobacter sp.]
MRYLLFTIAFCLWLAATANAAAVKPNIVFIMADDLGWADVGFHGGNAPTPNLDKVARESLELTQHYVAPVCSPTRTGLMTGRFWSRFGVSNPNNSRALPWDTVTLPKALKIVGYDTAITGKWHLGSKLEEGPNHFGFDHSYGSLAGGVGPYNHFYKKGEFSVTWHRNEKLITEEGHVTDLIAREATQWIAARSDKPFFLYVPFTAVHLPLKEPQAWLDKVPASIAGDVPRHYAACIMHLDAAVGQIVAALEKAGKREQTLLVFTSDNGGSTSENADTKYPADDYPDGKIPGNNTPLRGQKGDLYEGGIRVPVLVSWPNQIKPGKYDGVAHITDWMPTFCALAGYVPDKDLKWDGKDIGAALRGGPVLSGRTIYGVAPGFRSRMVRQGDWKLVVFEEKGKESKAELFDLARDPNEARDLSAQMPDKAAEMRMVMAEIAKADRDAVAND